jgi:RNA exonuclease 1
LTADGKALTRVCIIDFATSKVVYDQLVKPPSPITDYLTRYVYQSRTSFVPHHIFSFSGITAQALEPITTTLVDVQAYLRTLLTPSTILLGHSLESDLRALQLAHPRCIDSALLFHHPRGRPLKPGLAWLTRKWLGRTIQDRGPGGHDPEEDARACMDLLKAKIRNGTSFALRGLGELIVDLVASGPGFGEFRTDYEPVLARIARSQSRGPNGAGPRAAIVDHGNPGAWHGTSPAAPATTVACTNDAEVLDGVLSVLDTHEFVFARLMGLADALGCMCTRPFIPLHLWISIDR